jgi:glycogen(starch) synthase
MKIGMISRTIPPFDRGGIQRHVRDLSTALGEQGVEVHLYIRGEPIEMAPNVHVHPVPAFPLPRLTAGEYVSLSLNAGRAARKEDLDLVHVHSMYGFGQALVGKAPLVATLHGTQVSELRAVAAADRLGLNHLATDSISVVMEGYVARKANVIITVSEENRRDVIEHYDVPSEKVRVIPNGIWPSRYEVSDMSRKDIVFLGRLHERKGVSDLISAMPAVLEEHPDHRLIIIGSGELEGDLARRIERLGLGDSVDLAGHLDDDQVAERLSHARLFVMPSLYEGFGMVMIEAMAAGLPVVATPAGAAPEIISNGENGLLVDIDLAASDAEERRGRLADAITGALSDVEDLRRMGSAARELVVGRFSWDRVARMTIDIYDELLEGRK